MCCSDGFCRNDATCDDIEHCLDERLLSRCLICVYLKASEAGICGLEYRKCFDMAAIVEVIQCFYALVYSTGQRKIRNMEMDKIKRDKIKS